MDEIASEFEVVYEGLMLGSKKKRLGSMMLALSNQGEIVSTSTLGAKI